MKVLLLLLLTVNMVYSQDKIYLEKETKEGKVIDITSDKIKYKNPQNPGPVYSISTIKVLFVFNSSGDFIVFPMYDSLKAPQAFLQTSHTISDNSDVLFTKQGDKIECLITNENDSIIDYTASNRQNKIANSDLIGIIYKNGKHKILSNDFSLVANVLRKFQGQHVSSQQVSISIANNKEVKSANSTVKQAPTSNANKENKNEAKPILVSNNSNESITKKTNGNDNHKIATTNENSEYVDESSGVSFKDYEKMALQKTGELSAYLSVLCNKTTAYDQANKAIDEACTLFVNEDAIVELSSINNSNIQRLKIRDYLKHLKLVKYNKVDIKWVNIQYVSKLRKAPDGTYRGVITFEQTFTGFIEDKMAYSDKTQKNIEIVLKTYKKSVEGKTKTLWDVLLSDINVVETKNSL